MRVKRRAVLFLLLAASLALPCCRAGQASSLGEGYVFGQDYQYDLFQQGEPGSPLAQSEDTLFLQHESFLYAVPREGGAAPALLCGKEGCAHEANATCDAWVDMARLNWPALFYYDGALYLLESGGSGANALAVLKTCAPDGSGRKTVLSFDEVPSGLILHRGKVYYKDTAAAGSASVNVYERDLRNPGQKARVLFSYSSQKGVIQQLQAYGDTLYITGYDVVDIGNTTGDWTVRFDLRSGNVVKCFDDREPDQLQTSFLKIQDGHLYAAKNCGQSVGELTRSELWEYGLDGKGGHKLLENTYSQASIALRGGYALYAPYEGYVDMENPFAEHDRPVYVYDMETGAQAGVCTLEGYPGGFVTFAGGADGLCFVRYAYQGKIELRAIEPGRAAAGESAVTPFLPQ